MNPVVRYQVFVSSTYEDLREERQQATQAILEAGCFPSGMELFPASDDAQWELIKRVIEESDYYVVILAARYGSIGPQGLSYTEMEYDYAVQIGVPVLGFVRDNINNVPVGQAEKSEKGKRKLELFREKVLTRTCRKYSSPTELGMAVMKSLMTEARIRPRVGWVRADQARSGEEVQREIKLIEQLKEAEQLIQDLERELRDRAVLGEEMPPEKLAQGDDVVEINVRYSNNEKKMVSEDIKLTWNEIFRVIGPSMYGYIQNKREKSYGQDATYLFQDDLEDHIRSKIIDKVQNRRISLQSNQVDACILQFKELGLLMFSEKREKGGRVFRGITLTEEGERRLTMLSMRPRSVDDD